jgi:hypothetical protein
VDPIFDGLSFDIKLVSDATENHGVTPVKNSFYAPFSRDLLCLI